MTVVHPGDRRLSRADPSVSGDVGRRPARRGVRAVGMGVAVLLASVGGLTAACGSGSATTPATPVTPATGANGATGALVIDVALGAGTVRPNGQKFDVAFGRTVTLRITTDHDDEVHVHGDYDLDVQVTPGPPVTRSFVADSRGSVEVESHHPEKVIAVLNVR